MSRRFSEEEAQRIFARIAERQRASATTDTGLSIEDLEEAARAAGLDPGLVASAAAELDTPAAPTRTLASAPVEVVRQRVIPGPLDDGTWASMVSAARSRFGDAGIAGQIGHLREWTVLGGGRKNSVVTRLSAEPAGDGTRVTISQSIRDPVFGFTIAASINGAMALMFGALAAAGVDAELWIPFGILVVLGSLFGAGTQIGSRVWARQRGTQFDALLDRFELIARTAQPEPAAVATLAVAPRAPTARLDLDGLDDPLDDVRRPDRHRERS